MCIWRINESGTNYFKNGIRDENRVRRNGKDSDVVMRNVLHNDESDLQAK